jgi:hypothetical protein
MPRGKYVKNHPGRAALAKSFGGRLPKEPIKIPKTNHFLVPRKLRGIENQVEREKKMHDFISTLTNEEIQRIIQSYPLLEKTPDGETFANTAFTVKIERSLRK